jgi:DNA-directed RNA polymerase subunit RPC12/RpoP
MYNIFVNETNKEKEMNKLDALKKKCSRCGSTALDLYTDLTSFQTVWDCYNCGHKEPVIPTSAEQIIVKDEVAPAMYDDVEKDLMDIEYEQSPPPTEHKIDEEWVSLSKKKEDFIFEMREEISHLDWCIHDSQTQILVENIQNIFNKIIDYIEEN